MGASRIDGQWLTNAVSAVFVAQGFSPEAADKLATSLVDADMRGIPSHGAMLLPVYINRVRAGTVSRHEKPRTVTDFGAVATLDAQQAFGQLTGDFAMDLAIAKAREFGIGAVSVRNAFHFGGGFRYTEAAATEGFIGIAASNTRALMPAVGGAEAVVGNNPMAISVPGPNGVACTLDMALSEAALGKIRLAKAEGREIPDNWATDSEGVPTTDPTAAIGGLLLPMGGPKGFGLAVIVDVLTGVLSGTGAGSKVNGLYVEDTPNQVSHFFLALNVEAFGDQDYAKNLTDFLSEISNSKPRTGVERVMLPGQPERERYEEARSAGVKVETSVLNDLQRIADEEGVSIGEPQYVSE